jgi:SagB-type dehydrogenase family enzyme
MEKQTIHPSRREFLKGIFFLAPLGLHLLNPLKALSALSAKKEMPAMLPTPKNRGSLSLEEAIKKRRTVRSFSPSALNREQLSQILYAAQGITEERGFKRAAPSGGALYPTDVYAVVGKAAPEGPDPGVYRYIPSGHRLEKVTPGDRRRPLAEACLHQMWMAGAPVNLVITSEYSRICSKYGDRGMRYAMIEAGHVGQNIFLQAQALGLGAGIVGAFEDRKVAEVLGIPGNHEPLLVMPIGYPA